MKLARIDGIAQKELEAGAWTLRKWEGAWEVTFARAVNTAPSGREPRWVLARDTDSAEQVYCGRTEAEAVLRFRIAHPSERLLTFSYPVSVAGSFVSLVDTLREVKE